MKFIVETLIDITETGARKGQEKLPYNQQQNYQTLIQTIGLRVNLTANKKPTIVTKSAKEFGTRYVGEQKIWVFTFDVDYEGALSLDILLEDFDLVPIITGLEESVKINKSVFRTKDLKDKNIIFKLADY